jgi:hypothetical protein
LNLLELERAEQLDLEEVIELLFFQHTKHQL